MKSDFLQTPLPPSLARVISGYRRRQIHTGFSPARVFRLDAKNKETLYLKISPRALAHSLRQEKTKLEWLKNKLPVPEVRLFAAGENADYLLISAISGADASDDSLKNDIPHIIEQLTGGLKMIHALPIKDCPFDARHDGKIELVKKLVENKLVDEDDFDEIRKGRTAESLFQELLENQPAAEDLVFTHGDYCLPNVILKNKKLAGFVDWSNAGVADRYQDLALLTRSVIYNFGAEYEQNVFKTYGIEPDPQKIYFYQLLDEFF